MDWCQIYAEAKEWQTALTGLAAIATVYLAYYFSRKRDKEARKHQIRTVAAALYGEALAFRSDLSQAADILLIAIEKNHVLAEHQLGLFVPIQPTARNALSNQLGILEPQFVTNLTIFYQQIDEVRRAIEQTAKSSDPDTQRVAARWCIRAIESGQALEEELEEILNYSHRQESELSKLAYRLRETDNKMAIKNPEQ